MNQKIYNISFSLIITLKLAILIILSYMFSAPSFANDIDVAKRSVVRVVIVQPNPRGQIRTPNGNFAVISTGSGFAVGKDKIVTNHHVIRDPLRAPRSYFTFVVPSEGKKFFFATIETWDRGKDLALLTAKDSNFPPMAVYTGGMKSGAYVAALGYPGNIDRQTISRAEQLFVAREPTVSSGSYSNVQNVGPMRAIVHDANIARGNSGGPLVDECGRVLGVNTQQTDNFRGDSAFAFASATTELTSFLQSAKQAFNNVAKACVTAAQFEAQENARIAQEKAQQEREAVQAEREQIKKDQEIAQQRIVTERAITEEREEKLFIAIILILCAALLGVAGVVIFLQKDSNKKIGVALLSGAMIFAIGAIVIFFMRPSVNDAQLSNDIMPDDGLEGNLEDNSDSSLEDDDALKTAAKFPQTSTGSSKYICAVDRSAGRITTSSGDDVPITWNDKGCVNNNKQYAPSNSGTWSRILVPNESATVSILSFNPQRKSLTVDKYALGIDEMEKVRDVRSRITINSCTINSSAWDELGVLQKEIVDVLPSSPNEKLIYNCQLQ